MGLNPFKESNLADLQRDITQFFYDHFDKTISGSKELWKHFVDKGRERITIMFIPHSEKKIINFHISIFAISAISGILIITAVVTSLLIVSHTSTVKEVARLEKYGIDSEIQIKKYKDEINNLYSDFQKLKPELTHLYSLTPDSDIDSLWGKGGAINRNPPADQTYGDHLEPSEEILNLQEIENELKISKKAFDQIKKFLEYKKKIIENTPSIWPVDGYIVSRWGKLSSNDSLSGEASGINIEAYPGTEIKVAAPGKVVDIRWDSVLGLTVSVKHKYGFTTSYSHCQRVTVEMDQKVSKGEIIGFVGRTGRTQKYACFYQIRIGTEYVDPMPYLNRLSR